MIKRKKTNENQSNDKEKEQDKKKSKKSKIIKRTLITFLILFLLAVLSITGFVGYIYFSNKEKISEIISNGYNKVSEMDSSVFNNRYPTQLLDKDGNVLKEFKIINYKYQSYDNIDKRVMDAFIAIEDERFYEHKGVDYKSLTRALFKNIKSFNSKIFSNTASVYPPNSVAVLSNDIDANDK